MGVQSYCRFFHVITTVRNMRNYRWPLQVYKVKRTQEHVLLSSYPPPQKKRMNLSSAVPNNILQPLPLVDYLGPGRGEKK